ncbi:hypothetical protein LDL48_43110 [Wangella sp. NEAU-J3]|nr:hypothetical protein [Jidongwangia harbinensis]
MTEVVDLPGCASGLPPHPPACWGRLAATQDPSSSTLGGHLPPPTVDGEPVCISQLRTAGALPVERLLGALRDEALQGNDHIPWLTALHLDDRVLLDEA